MGLNLEEIYGQTIVEEQSPNEYSEYQPKKGYGWANTLPERQGLYDPEYEKDACGVGFAA
jgi:glutamate synthase (NADPH/NADH)